MTSQEVAAEKRSAMAKKAACKMQADRKSRSARLLANPVTTEVVYTDEERRVLQSFDSYRRATGNKFPTLVETLRFLKGIGYGPMEMAS